MIQNVPLVLLLFIYTDKLKLQTFSFLVMPALTRLQARSVQPADLEVPHRVERPVRLHDSWQDNAVAGERHELGNRSISSANGNHVTEDMFSKCKNKKCKTCPNMIFKEQISSNIINQTYPIINHSNENINCDSQNLVYILTCQGCNQQYVGETTIPLHKRINIHRTSEIVIKHFDKTCIAISFTIQVLEIQLLPLKIQAEEHIPVVSYKLCGTIRNKILNYKETVSSIYVDEDVGVVTNSDERNCRILYFVIHSISTQ